MLHSGASKIVQGDQFLHKQPMVLDSSGCELDYQGK
jgi:hypothetical protein